MENHLYFLLCAAVAPVLAGLGYIFAKDKYNKEPIHMLLGAFFLGCISVIPICLIEMILMAIGSFIIPKESALLSAAWNAFIVAAIIEESFKLLFLFGFIWKSSEFDERFDGIVYGVFVSLGFACAENILYVFSNFLTAGVMSAFSVSIVRALFAIPCHFFCGVILGYYLSLAKFERINNTSIVAQGITILKGLFLSILFHGIYDFILFYISFSYGNVEQNGEVGADTILFILTMVIVFLIFNILFWRFGYKRISHMASLLRENPQNELPAFITCSNCGNTYSSNLNLCPRCGQSTDITIQYQYNYNNPFGSSSNQNLHTLNQFISNHNYNASNNNPHDL